MARSLVQSKISQALSKVAGDAASENEGLKPGHMRLYSYYQPSLQAGVYGIETLQNITAIAGDDSNAQNQQVYNYTGLVKNPVDAKGLPVIKKQRFSVIAPQFTLDPKLINTYYPPAGHQDEGRVLPHIVFNNPHVPWFREAGLSPWMRTTVDLASDITEPAPVPAKGPKGRNLMPWLALLVFQPEELRVTADEAKLLHLDQMKSWVPTKTPVNNAFAMTVGQYLKDIQSRVYYEAGYQGAADADLDVLKKSPEVTSVIFPLKTQLEAIIHGKNKDFAPLKGQRLLSHVRHINTIGFPDAGVEEEGFFSVVISMMTGNQKEIAPSTHIVHLVSLEHLDATFTNTKSSYFLNSNSDRIGLVSLFAWTYTCIPDAINFEQTMITLADSAQPLRPPKQTLKALLDKSADKTTVDGAVSDALYQRLNSGYTLARWRTPTGEESVAFNRGPLVPMLPQEVPEATNLDKPARQWPSLSMTGKDYAVFDKSIGIMDVTYSSAWSLGKLMAISDSVFNAALMRFRSTVWADAASATRMSANDVQSSTSVLQNAHSVIKIGKAIAGADFSRPVSRINKPVTKTVLTSMDDPDLTTTFRDAIDKAVDHYASAGGAMYNGFDGAGGNSSDWEVILNWIHNVMYLAAIPAHVLFPEPSHLQSHNADDHPKDQPSFHPEALRYFYIDHAWIDAFIDGALSCANHLEPKFDYTRLRIKAVFNHYLGTPVGKTKITPPVPRYGFILRSAVVKSTPDLRLTVTCWKQQTDSQGNKTWIEDPDRDPLVQHTKMDEFTILSLVDCLPEEICVIKFAQPSHQQRFAIEGALTYDLETRLVKAFQTKLVFTRLYTDDNQAPSLTVHDPGDSAPIDADEALMWRELKPQYQVTDQTSFYDLETRCISPVKIAQAANDKLVAWGKDPIYKNNPPYNDTVPNSCELGLELNDHSFQLEIKGVAPKPSNPPFPSWTRKLWIGGLTHTPFIPSVSRVKVQALVKNVNINTGPKVIPKDDIKTAPHNPSTKVTLAPKTLLNTMRAVLTKTSPVADVRFLAPTTLADPFINSSNPAFELLVHPDYRPAPQRPNPDPNGHLINYVYSPLDYIPTKTQSVFDLIFAIRRRSNDKTDLKLQSLTIEVPVSITGTNPDQDDFREPLLVAGDYSGAGIRMCSNARFVPTVENGPASSIGSPSWDSLAVLIIRIAPVSSRADGTTMLLADGKTSEVSVRLAQLPLVQTIDTSSTALVAQGKDASGTPQNAQMPRGRCLIRMSEQYGDDRTDEWSWCVALKVDTGDKDPEGNVI
ncbi:hypothetical protein CC80DRAFT_577196 [Byssothecium circinans]|uniref:Uncharacterized protein n=1 Tax=Byssothecium circinans TaxID=147558 RepID=A0A6A5TEP5_9PLEO|nr:hypothetical protein CC80DRAFT_577196 [Byssothecium circinans]